MNSVHIKKRRVPFPTKVSGYLFGHLVPGDVAADSATSDMDPAIAEMLKNSFSPAEALSLTQSAAEEERTRSDSLETMLEAAWGRVEDVMARNKERRRLLDEELPRIIASMDTYIFWTPNTVARRYHLPEPMEFASSTPDANAEEDGKGTEKERFEEAAQAAPSHIREGALEEEQRWMPSSSVTETSDPNTTPFATCEAVKVSSAWRTAAATVATMSNTHRSNAWNRPSKELLDPSKQLNCLRRLFAPILQRRQELPKNLTLLLNAVQKIQTEELPEIEKIIETGFFDLPLHRPLRYISTFILRYLTKEPRGVSLETEFFHYYKPAMASLGEACEKVRCLNNSSNTKKTLDNSDKANKMTTSATTNTSSASDAAAELIYGTLLNELRERRELDTHCNGVMRSIKTVADDQHAEMDTALVHCDTESRNSLHEIQCYANAYVDELRKATCRMNAIIEEIETCYSRERNRLVDSLRTKQHQAERSELLQEKLARRIREATKEWYAEQLKYEALVQEITTESVMLRQLELSHDQLAALLDERIAAAASEAKTQWITDAMQGTEKVRAEFVTQCRQHMERLRTDEHFRRCRMASCVGDNALAWSRCLNDLAALYERHYDNLSSKCNTSLQLRYLLAYEKGQAVEDLHQLQREMNHLDARWAEISAVLEELDMDVPPLTRCEAEAESRELRRAMQEHDSCRLIRRNFTRLAPRMAQPTRPGKGE